MRLASRGAAGRGLVLGLLAAAGACMTAPTSAEAENEAVAESCALTVRFGSYAMGIDGGAAQAVEQLLRSDPAVQGFERRPWGKEGEFDLCARIARARDAERLFQRIRPLLPAKPRGPITVTLADGRSYHAPAQ
jgi:hypothetical protein